MARPQLGAPPARPADALRLGDRYPLGDANNPVTDPAAARPAGIPKVYWQTPTQPANWADGDEWVSTA